MSKTIPRLVLTPGDPAGIGPDLCVQIAGQELPAELVIVADTSLLAERASMLNLETEIVPWDDRNRGKQHVPGKLTVLHQALIEPARAGVLNRANARYVLNTLDRAVAGCLDETFDALVTGPVHKGIINEAGIPFTGHTEYLAEKTGCPLPIMMLATPGLRVALATTHLPLSKVAAEITREHLIQIIEELNREMQRHFAMDSPRILVCGLNPHAGEDGHLGREEIDIMIPALRELKDKGINVQGPLPADTLFVPERLKQADVVLAMYHDQGLPVLKHMGFGQAVNITLGLPIIRTSVDHGVALELAGTGKAKVGSLRHAVDIAIEMVGKTVKK